MDKQTKKNMEAKGWKIGTVEDFLDLTTEESIFIEIKLALSRSLKERRKN